MRALVFAAILGASLVQPAAADRLPDAPVSTVPAPTVKLIDAGKNPTKPLRFTVKKGLKKVVVTTMRMGLEMDLGAGGSQRQDIPVLEMIFDMKVTDVLPNGDIRYEMVFRKPRAVPDAKTPPNVLAAIDDSVKDLAGVKGYSLVSNRGFVKEASFDVPPNAPPTAQQMFKSMEQSFSQLAAPMPEEAVGVGAKWETTTALNANGIAMTQVATNTLVSFAGNKATLDIKLVQTAKPQKITTNGITADLHSYTANGGGRTHLDLSALMPKDGSMGMASEMKMGAAGQTIGVKLSLDMKIKMK
ncbi:MAG: DUF6263 family protein [Kofleriaceae bacterium]|nr:DUF6263 family protein [Kofleriaceae bacterium]